MQIKLFITVNKRLDEWVGESWLDTRKVQFPRRDGAPTAGTTTPKKTHIGSGGGVMPNFLSMCVYAISYATIKITID